MSKDKVINLGEYKEKRPEIVWECSCGEQLFYIMQATGGAKCRTCSKTVWFAVGDSRDEQE